MRSDDEMLDPSLHPMARALRSEVAVRPGMAQRVMTEVRRPLWRRGGAWLLRPRDLSLSPLTGLTLAAGIATLLFMARPARTPAGPVAVPAVAAVAAAQPMIRFVLNAPGATTVSVVGDFNDWETGSTPLRPTVGANGVWHVEVPLAPGRHEYAFVVDGAEWRADPGALGTTDDFGRPNSVMTVTRS